METSYFLPRLHGGLLFFFLIVGSFWISWEDPRLTMGKLVGVRCQVLLQDKYVLDRFKSHGQNRGGAFGQRSAPVFAKAQRIKNEYFMLRGPYGLSCSYSTLVLKHVNSLRRYLNDCVPIKHYYGHWTLNFILFSCAIKYYSLITSSNHLKM